ncbi:hypothetical protein [Legionella sp. W05-934-2]|jgi:hypothetical protein|uniref:hypothetical protein n=1 Tax=Legionella sp. W05-934-2 TaxID=1198649 RepID=UPI003462DD19
MFEWLKNYFDQTEENAPNAPNEPNKTPLQFEDLGVQHVIFARLDLPDIQSLASSCRTLNAYFKNEDRTYQVQFNHTKPTTFTYKQICEQFSKHDERVQTHRKRISQLTETIREKQERIDTYPKLLQAAENPTCKPVYSSMVEIEKVTTLSDEDNDNSECLCGTACVCGACCGAPIGAGVSGGITQSFLSSFVWTLVSGVGGGVSCMMWLCCFMSTHELCIKPLSHYSHNQLRQINNDVFEIKKDAKSIEEDEEAITKLKKAIEKEEQAIKDDKAPVYSAI